MNNIQFPVNFTFNISTLSNDFTATDANGSTIGYVKQKMFKLKEDINIYNNESKTEINYKIKADRWLDFSAAYAFYNKEGNEIGKVARKGWKSLWKAKYEIIDKDQRVQYTISEENAWIKVLDGLLGEIPILGILTGYLFNPAYIVTNNEEKVIYRLKKMPSFFGRRFELNKLEETLNGDDSRIMLSLMMMSLLERRRG
ncbi:hypothetical protein E9993_13125 [Labilibacter sediminis]|nr:hypothetical protein E9993_13125 [Labilibacter sediminis]